jgi:Holliday junction resolvase RusA-like endonuclease
MAEQWNLWVAGIPKSARPGTIVVSHTTGRPFLRKRNTGWATRIAEAAQAAAPPALLDGPLMATLVFRLPRPVSGPAAKRAWPTVRPDVERLASGVLDALQGIVFRDDALIVRLQLVKVYDGAPGVQITVAQVDEPPPTRKERHR